MQKPIKTQSLESIKESIHQLLLKNGSILELYKYCQQLLNDLDNCVLTENDQTFIYIKKYGKIKINPQFIKYININDMDLRQLYLNEFVPLIVKTIKENSKRIKL